MKSSSVHWFGHKGQVYVCVVVCMSPQWQRTEATRQPHLFRMSVDLVVLVHSLLFNNFHTFCLYSQFPYLPAFIRPSAGSSVGSIQCWFFVAFHRSTLLSNSSKSFLIIKYWIICNYPMLSISWDDLMSKTKVPLMLQQRNNLENHFKNSSLLH